MAIGSTRFVLGVSIVTGGILFAIIFGAPHLCKTLSGYCVNSQGLEWIFLNLGLLVTIPGFMLMFGAVKRQAKK